jgi:hypothetical protein
MTPTGPKRAILRAPFKKPPLGGALDVCTHRIFNSLLEFPMAVTLRTWDRAVRRFDGGRRWRRQIDSASAEVSVAAVSLVEPTGRAGGPTSATVGTAKLAVVSRSNPVMLVTEVGSKLVIRSSRLQDSCTIYLKAICPSFSRGRRSRSLEAEI